MTYRLFFRAAAASVLLAAIACGPRPRATPVYDEENRLARIDYDYDGDGRVDVRTYMRDGRPERLEGDADGDGTTDRWEYYGADGALLRVGGSTRNDGVEDSWAYTLDDQVRVEVSTRRDGVIDRREFYRNDVLLRAEGDSNQDGLVDIWEQYEEGRMAVLLLDEAKTSGRPTRRLVYGAEGSPRVEVDPDGDGTFVPLVTAR